MNPKTSLASLATILIILFAIEVLNSQPVLKHKHARRVTAELEAAWRTRIPEKVLLHSPHSLTSSRSGYAEFLENSYYDYAENTGRMLALTPGGVHIVYSTLLSPAGSLHSTYNFFDESISLSYGGLYFDQTFGLGSTGWGRVINGKNNEAVVCFHGGGSWLYRDQNQAGYSFINMLTSGGPVLSGSHPGIAMNSATDEIWYVSASQADGDSLPDSFYYSNDYGATFTPMAFPSSSPYSSPVNNGVWPVLNPANTNEVAFALVERDRSGLHSNALSWHVTSDNGASWTSTVLYDESQWFSDASGNYNYLVSNFSQFNNMYTDDGTFHVVFNGYGLVDSANVGDTLAIFPIVYWNSNTQQFVELTDPEIGHKIDGDFSRAILTGYPGNGIGNAYPTIATGFNCQVLVVLWQQVEVDANGLPIIAPDTSGNPSGFYATDIWAALSLDNGTYWTSPFLVSGSPGQSDLYPAMAREMKETYNPDSVYIYYYYYEDGAPGVSLFGEGDVALGQWIFNYRALTLPLIDNASKQADNISQQFVLRQNYPNPFNPSTTINYQLPVSTKVELTIYNLLGQQIRTLVNAERPAGFYEIKWDGRDDAGGQVASGIYLYRLTTAEFVQSRKMVLIR